MDTQMPVFTVKDADAWSRCVSNNQDPYGFGAVSYAARWAAMMEARIAAGAKLEDIAKETSHKADTEGITGFMYGCAVSILSAVWKHGEDLRQWHNLDTQVHREGEKANREGDVLNPAILQIGGEST
jgi:hypothetical protein